MDAETTAWGLVFYCTTTKLPPVLSGADGPLYLQHVPYIGGSTECRRVGLLLLTTAKSRKHPRAPRQ